MPRLLKIIGSVFALVVFLLVLAVYYVLTWDPNENKDLITVKFNEATGRTLTLGGDISLELYPWLALTVNDVSISNAIGFSSTPLFRAQHAEFRVKLMPLLNNSIEIDTVVLDGVALNIEVAGDGSSNLDNPGTTDEPASANGNSDAVLNNLVIGGVDIRNTSLVYDNQADGSHYEIRDFNASIGELIYGEPLEISMNLQAASRTPQIAASLQMTGTVLYDLDNERYDLQPLLLEATLTGPTVPGGSADLRLSTALHSDLDADVLTLDALVLDALDAHLEAGVTITRATTPTPAINASINLAGEDLAVIFRIIEQEELANRVASLNGMFSVNASVEADLRNGSLNIPTLEMNLLNAAINGNLGVERFDSDDPSVNGRLTASGPDLPTLIEVAGMLQGGRDAPLTRYGRDLGRLPDKSFSIETSFAADMRNGNLNMPILEANLLGSTISCNMAGSNIQTDTPRLQGQLNARGNDLPLLLQVAGQLQGGADNPLNVYGRQLRNGVRDRSFTIATGFDADLQTGNIQLPSLDARLLGFTLNGNLNARNMQGSNGNINGELKLQGNNLPEVLNAMEMQDLAEVIRSIDLSVSINGTGGNVRLSPLAMSLVAAGPQLGNAPQTLRLDADTQLDLGKDSLQLDSFTLNGLGLDVTGTVSATNLSGNTAYNGTLSIPAFNARRLLQQLNVELQPMADGTTLQSVALATSFAGTTSSIALNQLSLKLDQSTLNGSMDLKDLSTTSGTFALDIDTINADRYMAPPAAASSNRPSASDDTLPVDRLRAMDLKGAVNIGQLTISGLNMNNIRVQLNADKGNITLNPLQAALYEGSFNGDIRLDVTGQQPTGSIETTLATINLEPMLQDFMDATYVSGKGTIRLALNGSGPTVSAIKANLNGNGAVNLEDGIFHGVDVADTLGRVETMIRNRSLVQLPQGGQTEFETFSATLNVNQGVVSSNDLSIKAPGWRVSGSGTLVNLNNDSINFRMDTVVDKGTVTSNDQQYDIGGYSLPIACTGNIRNPRCLPDAQGIFAAAVGNAVQQRLGEFLQDRLGVPAQQNATPTDGTTQEPPAEETPQQVDPAQELINRAFDRLLRN
jgi:AsmA protein